MTTGFGSTLFYACAALFGAVTLFQLRSWRGQLDLFLLLLATLVTAAWAVANAALTPLVPGTNLFLSTLDYLRVGVWSLLIYHLYASLGDGYRGSLRRLRLPLVMGTGGLALSLIGSVFIDASNNNGAELPVLHVDLAGLLLLTAGALMMLFRLLAALPRERYRAYAALASGILALLACDGTLYTLMLISGDPAAFHPLRGLCTATGAVFLFFAVRNPAWSQRAHLSHTALFTFSVGFGGVAFVGIALLGSLLLRAETGHSGALLRLLIVGLAALVLLAFYLSEPHRARLKVFLNKHFFNYKYDYRDQWLRFIRTLSRGGPGAHLLETVIQALAQIVGSGSGSLWLRSETGSYELAAHLQSPAPSTNVEPADGSLARFLKNWQWVINCHEYNEDRELYQDLSLPAWLSESKSAWLVVPLMQDVELLGFVVIDQPAATPAINWEDHDLLKTAGRQAATHLAQLMAVQALVEAREFQAFSRLSAFVIHDLKNLVAQLSLVVSNAAKHKSNPAFMEDAIGTVQNCVAKMNRLLAQLRKGKAQPGKNNALNLANVLRDVLQERQEQEPRPTLEVRDPTLTVMANADRLSSVFTHLVQNAQEATSADGWVRIQLWRDGSCAKIEIADNGCGMDSNFIRDRLFRPFDSTKGQGGMGIGAYESRDYVRELNGDIAVSSAPGKGSVFVVTLPLASAGPGEAAK